MKSLPAVVTLTTVAILLLLAVASSFFPDLPFTPIASCVVGVSCAVGVVASFVADYGPGSTRPIAIRVRETQLQDEPALAARRRSLGRQIDPRPDIVAVNDLMATIGMRNDPATLSML
jgi:hypothetical protein